MTNILTIIIMIIITVIIIIVILLLYYNYIIDIIAINVGMKTQARRGKRRGKYSKIYRQV